MENSRKIKSYFISPSKDKDVLIQTSVQISCGLVAKRNMDTNNAIVKHLLDSNHNISIDNNSIILKENDDNKRKNIESIIISKKILLT